MLRHSQGRLLIIAAITFLSAITAVAQSGRQIRKTTPAPVPTPVPEAPLAKPEEKPKPALTLIVGMQHVNLFDRARTYNANGALQAVEDRLDDHSGVKVSHFWGETTRSSAIQRAKSEKEAYVVLLELSLDRMAGDSDGEWRLSYWVFSPVTAKVKTSGSTYPRMYRNRGGILNPRRAGIYGDDYQLQEASRDAAERILKAFQLHLQRKPPSSLTTNPSGENFQSIT